MLYIRFKNLFINIISIRTKHRSHRFINNIDVAHFVRHLLLYIYYTLFAEMPQIFYNSAAGYYSICLRFTVKYTLELPSQEPRMYKSRFRFNTYYIMLSQRHCTKAAATFFKESIEYKIAEE